MSATDTPATDQPDLLPDGPVLVTVVSADNRIIKILQDEQARLTIAVSGRAPVVLDRFQSGALRSALSEGPEGFTFQRGMGRVAT